MSFYQFASESPWLCFFLAWLVAKFIATLARILNGTEKVKHMYQQSDKEDSDDDDDD